MIEVDPFIDPYVKTSDLDKSILIKLDTTILVVTVHLGFGLKRQNIFLKIQSGEAHPSTSFGRSDDRSSELVWRSDDR